jgi:hypothetical protein
VNRSEVIDCLNKVSENHYVVVLAFLITETAAVLNPMVFDKQCNLLVTICQVNQEDLLIRRIESNIMALSYFKWVNQFSNIEFPVKHAYYGLEVLEPSRPGPEESKVGRVSNPYLWHSCFAYSPGATLPISPWEVRPGHLFERTHPGSQHDNLGDEISTQPPGTTPHFISPARGEKI